MRKLSGIDIEISSENIVNILVQYAIFWIRTGKISTDLWFFALSALRFIKSIKKLIKVTTYIPQDYHSNSSSGYLPKII